MAQKLWRVVRSCCELGDANPIVQIHDQVRASSRSGDGELVTLACTNLVDAMHTSTPRPDGLLSSPVQGAGGNCNVVKEIIYPLGGEVDVRAVKVSCLSTARVPCKKRVGDETLSVLEIWGAEYQENDAILIKPESRDALQAISCLSCAVLLVYTTGCGDEETYPLNVGATALTVIGKIDGSGRVRVLDKLADPKDPIPEDLDLDKVLGKMPSKTYNFSRPSAEEILAPMALPENASLAESLDRVLRLPSVCSKRFLTTKVDRHVTGQMSEHLQQLLSNEE
eukprot:1156607-Pelagomonas_calceolata.AAC.9